MKNINYIVIREPQLKTFESKIKELLKKGWLLHGNLIVSEDLLYQAMILPEIANN